MPTMSTSQPVLDTRTSSLDAGMPALNVRPETSGLQCLRALPSDNHPHRAKTTSVFDVFPSSSERFPTISRAHSDGSHISENFSLRSAGGMQGLLLAEGGGGLVELDPLGGGSGFRQGTRVIPGLITPGGGAFSATGRPRPRYRDAGKTLPSRVGPSDGARRSSLARRGTFLSQGATPMRKAAELKSLLGNSRAKVKSGAKIPSAPNLAGGGGASPGAGVDVPAVALEQGKSHARVEIDILLDSDICVEGHYLTGKVHVKVRKRAANDSPILLARGKIRVVGFEGIPGNNDRHTFFQHAASLSDIGHSPQAVYASPPDEEGFSRAHDGLHVIPFVVKLPVTDGVRGGAKGPFDNRSGVIVKYIIIASFKLKDSATSERSLAHFYRSCQVYPYLNASTVMAPASRPLISTAARNIFLGGQGKLKLAASLHRNFWVAGQRCFVGIAVQNDTKRSVKGLVISLIRTVTVFNPQPHLDVDSPQAADPDACQTTTTRKLVAETTLEAGQRGLRGHVTAKGWWTGVSPGTRANFMHFILLPTDALSIVRSRLVEVQYDIRVSLVAGTLSSEVSVMLPVRIISQLSVDPPPSYPYLFDQRDANPVPPLCIPDIHPSTSVVPSPVRGDDIYDDLDERGINGGVPVLSALDGSDSPNLGTSLGAAGQSAPNVPAHSALGIPLSKSLDGYPNSDASYATFYHSVHGIPEGARYHEIREGTDDLNSGEDGDKIINLSQDGVYRTTGDLSTEDSDEEVDLIVGSARLDDDVQFIPSFDGIYLGKEEQTLRRPRRRALSTISSRSSYSTSSVENLSASQIPNLEKISARAAHEGPPGRPVWGTEASGGDGGSHDLPTPGGVKVSAQRQNHAVYARPPESDLCSASTAAPSQTSLFSQRVDRLIAVRRATIKAPLSSGVIPDDSSDGDHGTSALSTEEGTSSRGETSSSPSETSAPPITAQLAGQHRLGRCAHSVAPSKTAPSVSTRAAPLLHGKNSVKARIAELEGMRSAVLSSNH